nr:rab effector Noc2 isoform X6 [Macaca fascicularis]
MADTIFGSGNDQWVCPNDRQLALRAKLQTGWSVHTYQTEKQRRNQHLSPAEVEAILQVIQRAERLDVLEQQRIGRLVERLETMRRNVMGNGLSQCLLCGEVLGFLGSSSVFCKDCRKGTGWWRENRGCGSPSWEFSAFRKHRTLASWASGPRNRGKCRGKCLFSSLTVTQHSTLLGPPVTEVCADFSHPLAIRVPQQILQWAVLSSDAVYPEAASDPAGRGLGPRRLSPAPMPVARPGLWNF